MKFFIFIFFLTDIRFTVKVIIEVTRVAFHVDFNPWATIEKHPQLFSLIDPLKKAHGTVHSVVAV